MPQTPAQRQQALYERRKASGLVLVRAWVPPAQVPKVKRFIERLGKGKKS